MQYLLTKEELDNLRPLQEVQDLKKVRTALRTKLIKAAGFTCIHDHHEGILYAYCDDCPAYGHIDEDYNLKTSSLCELPKNLSK